MPESSVCHVVFYLSKHSLWFYTPPASMLDTFFIKYNYFHKEQRPRYTPNPFHAESLHYNAQEDYYVCPMEVIVLDEGFYPKIGRAHV